MALFAGDTAVVAVVFPTVIEAEARSPRDAPLVRAGPPGGRPLLPGTMLFPCASVHVMAPGDSALGSRLFLSL